MDWLAGERRPVVVLERVEAGKQSSYREYGRAPCVACLEWVWLGDQTYPAVASGQVDPICLPCATRLFPVAGAVAIGQIDDH